MGASRAKALRISSSTIPSVASFTWANASRCDSCDADNPVCKGSVADKIVCGIWLRDAGWKLRVFTLEVTSDGGRTRDANDYILKRSAEERSNCHRRELLQFSRRKAADEARGPTRGVSSKNSRADYKQTGTRPVGVLHVFRRETCAGAGRGRTFLSEKFTCQ